MRTDASKLTGFAVAVFRIGNLVESALASAATKGISVTITDMAESDGVYRSSEAAVLDFGQTLTS